MKNTLLLATLFTMPALTMAAGENNPTFKNIKVAMRIFLNVDKSKDNLAQDLPLFNNSHSWTKATQQTIEGAFDQAFLSNLTLLTMNWQKLKDNDKFTVRITITNRDTGESLITQEKTFNYDRNAAADKVQEAIWNKYTNLLEQMLDTRKDPARSKLATLIVAEKTGLFYYLNPLNWFSSK